MNFYKKFIKIYILFKLDLPLYIYKKYILYKIEFKYIYI
jgi:hypothetical protein